MADYEHMEQPYARDVLPEDMHAAPLSDAELGEALCGVSTELKALGLGLVQPHESCRAVTLHNRYLAAQGEPAIYAHYSLGSTYRTTFSAYGLVERSEDRPSLFTLTPFGSRAQALGGQLLDFALADDVPVLRNLFGLTQSGGMSQRHPFVRLRIMESLLEHPQGHTTAKIANDLMVGPTTISNTIRNMARGGVIDFDPECPPGPVHRRITMRDAQGDLMHRASGLVRRFQTGKPDFLQEGKAQLAAIMANPEAMRRLITKGSGLRPPEGAAE